MTDPTMQSPASPQSQSRPDQSRQSRPDQIGSDKARPDRFRSYLTDSDPWQGQTKPRIWKVATLAERKAELSTVEIWLVLEALTLTFTLTHTLTDTH